MPRIWDIYRVMFLIYIIFHLFTLSSFISSFFFFLSSFILSSSSNFVLKGLHIRQLYIHWWVGLQFHWWNLNCITIFILFSFPFHFPLSTCPYFYSRSICISISFLLMTCRRKKTLPSLFPSNQLFPQQWLCFRFYRVIPTK